MQLELSTTLLDNIERSAFLADKFMASGIEWNLFNGKKRPAPLMTGPTLPVTDVELLLANGNVVTELRGRDGVHPGRFLRERSDRIRVVGWRFRTESNGEKLAKRTIHKAKSPASISNNPPTNPGNEVRLPDPNEPMIKRDGKPVDMKSDAFIAELVKNCKLFGDPKPEPLHPLYRISPITKTGTGMLWGAEHFEE